MERPAAPQDLEALLAEEPYLRSLASSLLEGESDDLVRQTDLQVAAPFRTSGSEHDSDSPEFRLGAISERGRPKSRTMGDRRWGSASRVNSSMPKALPALSAGLIESSSAQRFSTTH